MYPTPYVTSCSPARELEKKGAEIIKLHIGDPNKFDFETPKHVRDALCRAVEVNDNGTPSPRGTWSSARPSCRRRSRRTTWT